MEILKNHIYRHYKGDYYLVIDIAKDSNTLEEMVVYRALYEDGQLWVRPLEEFASKLTEEKDRYQLVTPKSNRSSF